MVIGFLTFWQEAGGFFLSLMVSLVTSAAAKVYKGTEKQPCIVDLSWVHAVPNREVSSENQWPENFIYNRKHFLF